MYHPPRTRLPPFPPCSGASAWRWAPRGEKATPRSSSSSCRCTRYNTHSSTLPQGTTSRREATPNSIPPPRPTPIHQVRTVSLPVLFATTASLVLLRCAGCHCCFPPLPPESELGLSSPALYPFGSHHLNPKPSPRYPPAPMLSCNPLPLPCCSRGDTAAPSPDDRARPIPLSPSLTSLPIIAGAPAPYGSPAAGGTGPPPTSCPPVMGYPATGYPVQQ